MNGTHAISRRATMGYIGAAVAAAVSAKWAVAWGAGGEAGLLEIPLDGFVGVLPDGESGPAGILAAMFLDAGPVGATGLRAYFCNGAEISEWFAADIAGNEFSLTAENGAALEGRIGPAAVTGTFRLPAGAERSFELHPATGAEGLYYLARSDDGRVYGAAEGGVGISYLPDGDRIEGAFVQPGGIVEPIDLPVESVRLGASPEGAVEPGASASYRAIVTGSGSVMKISGTFVDPRPARKCITIKQVVALADGSQQVEFVTVCNR
jgi:hypothetical protein